ncbi:TBC1 domain family member 22A [Zootermopsis nevadensis]|uniref:TBC1 domain family member 22A n=1 Tax=Zootermopsis nevadensis TaxID=136037 RepID=A0A067QZN9_ZOONE|nr:TBC1 domain family member 22A [Zootermopsis nevadensis]
MDGIGENFSEQEAKASFWKKSTKAVPGRPSPKKDPRVNRQRNSCSTSFQDFQESVSDAWDIGDDEFCIVSDVKISKKVAQSAALSVINSHRCPVTKESVPNSQPCDFTISEGKKIEAALQCLASHTDPHVASPAHRTSTPQVPSSPPLHRQFPGHPQPLRGSTGRSKFHIPSREGGDCETSKLERFQPLLETPLLNLEELRQLSWSGIPVKVRAITWRLLSGHLPANFERRQQVLERKRVDYWNLVKQYYDTERDETYQDTYRQIHIDIPRMNPLIALFQQKTVQEMFERILFIWAIRHPASGYVQGINDLVTPFYVVFLQEVIPAGPLHRHLQHHGVDYLQFSFRWMNNLLTRELPLHCTIRLWDTYLAESDGFASFQLYVCAAFLLHWRRELLMEKDFQGLMLMLQNLPTQNWSDSEIGMLVAEAYRLKFTFADAPNHLQSGER